MKSSKVRWVDIEKLITLDERRNTENRSLPVLGINREKRFMPTVASLDGVDLRKYKVIRKGDFIFSGMQTGRDMCIRIGLYDDDHDALISPAYTTFTVSDEEEVLPEYFFMYFNRSEMDRYGAFCSDGSVRSNLDWDRFIAMQIPLPETIDEQRAIVEAWNSLRNIKEQNEALAAPLMQLCQSYIQDCKHKYSYTPIGQYIDETDERNIELKIKLSQGVANTKVFQDPKQVAANSKADKIVRTGQFAYNRATTRNGEKISIAYREGPDCTVSSAYGVFSITEKNVLDPYFLWMWFRRPEFDRYARYMSKGSAHEFFDFDEMKRVEIPLPPIDVQRAIVSLYQCALEYKALALAADEQAKNICSPLLQQIIHQS